MRLACFTLTLGSVIFCLFGVPATPSVHAAIQLETTQPVADGWFSVHSKTGPGPRYAAQMVWDSGCNVLLLFAGETNIYQNGQLKYFQMNADLWAFDPANQTWTEMHPVGEKPSPRAYYGFCYDSKNQRAWLYGGFGAANGQPKPLSDLWYLDCTKEVWTKVDVKGDGPSPRDGMDIYYIPSSNSLLVFGGLEDLQKGIVSNDVWLFDVAASKWTKKTAGPSGRFLSCTAFDAKAEKLYVSGGFGKGGKVVDDPDTLWVYDLAKDAWSSSTDKGTINFPAGRMVYIPHLDRLLIFGGNDNHTEYWNDRQKGEWFTAGAAAPAPRRSYHAMAYDPKSRQLFVFGGTQGGTFVGPCVEPDLWIRKY